MRSNSSPSTLEHLFNELSERAESSFRALKSHHQKIAELTQASAGLKEENQRLQEKCAYLDSTLGQKQAELEAAYEASLHNAVNHTALAEPEKSDISELPALEAENAR